MIRLIALGLSGLLSLLLQSATAQYWQQKVKYVMNVQLDVNTNMLTGKQKIDYYNNSPDKLDKLFFHLYWNAFQPNSMMDMRSRELGKHLINGRYDWDPRVKDRISQLKPDEAGFQKIISFKMNGISQPFFYHETILEVKLKSPILPSSKVLLEVEFESQVPLQVRRAGRDNPNTGVRYSMSQWYPKICEYDKDGWHPNPYVAREFYGVWGDFEVNIRIDKKYKLGATGTLVNAAEIGWGYDKDTGELKPVNAATRLWRFSGSRVHDFVWAADTAYRHISRKTYAGGPVVHVIYRPKRTDANPDSAWRVLADAAVKVLPFIEKNFGKYPYPQYSFIQGGDGGMEYPMATLVSGPSLGTAFHEWMHSWYQMILGFNESKYAWMDEGFTNFAEDRVMKFHKGRPSAEDYRDMLKSASSNDNIRNLLEYLPEDHADGYAGYFNLVKSGLQEPLTTHADHYETNYAYSVSSYSKGQVFLSQLGYILGDSVRDKILLSFYEKWKFRHPDADDFIRLAEEKSGIQLDWYKEYWIEGTKTINYSIDSLWEQQGKTKIRLKRIGNMPMPVDLRISFKDSATEDHLVPLDLMFGNKRPENPKHTSFVEAPWKWTHPTYIVETSRRLTDLRSVEIDPSRRMADVDRKNNKLSLDW
jgi:hypothetical protein